PNRADLYPLKTVSAIVQTDTSGIVLLHHRNFGLTGGEWLAVYPANKVVRLFSGVTSLAPAAGLIGDADFDPISHGIITTDPQRRGLLLYPAGGGTPSLLAGGGASNGDGSAASVFLSADFLAVDPNGNVFFNDAEPLAGQAGGRLRELRRSDMQVVT